MTILGSGNVGIGTTSPTNVLSVVGSINQTDGNLTGNMIYAEGYGIDIGVVSMASAGVYYNITNFTMGESNGVAWGGNGSVIPPRGLYKVDGSYSFSGSASQEYHIAVAKNNVVEPQCHAERVIGSGGDVGNAGVTCFVRVDGDDWLNTQIENMDSAGDPTIHNINFNMWRIGN
jgi:hypothetical protein